MTFCTTLSDSVSKNASVGTAPLFVAPHRAAQARVEQVADGVAEHVEAVHHVTAAAKVVPQPVHGVDQRGALEVAFRHRPAVG